jgi:hypothetical protein
MGGIGMIAGFESFKNWFKGYESEYIFIGGAACDMLLSEEKRNFRVTKERLLWQGHVHVGDCIGVDNMAYMPYNNKRN